MADFIQQGLITTLHDLGVVEPERLERQLEVATGRDPLGLILPVTAEDMRAPAFARVINQLQGERFIERIVVVLGRTDDENDFRQAVSLIEPLGNKARVLWTDGERVQELYRSIRHAGLPLAPDGKGRAVWTAYGYLLAFRSLSAYVLHDCDIVNYDRSLLVRLCLPMVARGFDYEFCKGYYARHTDRMHGRVVRLLVSPLVHALITMLGSNRFLRYLASFRYPLAGEFAVTSGLARTIRVPGDWGLEIGTLAEVYRSSSVKRVCQVDLSLSYEHKHQALVPEQGDVGLIRMARDILVTFFRTLSGMGVTFQKGDFDSLRSGYLRCAQDAIRQYYADALMNGLEYDRNDEERAVEGFSQQIEPAAEEFRADPAGGVVMPNWSRVFSVYPDFPDSLRQAAREDAADIMGGLAAGAGTSGMEAHKEGGTRRA